TTNGPHNSFVGYAFYAGYPCAALVIAAFVLALWRLWRARHLTMYAPALFGAIVGAAVIALTNVALESPYIGGPIWALLAWAAAVAAHVGTSRASPRVSRGQTQDTPIARLIDNVSPA